MRDTIPTRRAFLVCGRGLREAKTIGREACGKKQWDAIAVDDEIPAWNDNPLCGKVPRLRKMFWSFLMLWNPDPTFDPHKKLRRRHARGVCLGAL